MNQDDINKYKILYEVSKHEYQLEIERSKSLDEKAIKYSTLIGIIIVAYSAALSKLDIFLKYACTCLTKGFLYFFCILMFMSILSCLYQISKALRMTALEKVPLNDPDLNDTFTNEDERTCLWYMSEVYNKLIINNAKKLDEKIAALELAYKEMYCLACIFSILCLYILILYTSGVC